MRCSRIASIVLAGLLAQPALAAEPGCSVALTRGAASPQGTDSTMRVAGDGRACAVELLGVPAERRNPATAMRVTRPPANGSVQFDSGRAVYRAHRGFSGNDGFAIEADALGNANQPIVLRVRVAVTVTAP
jgi:hypothetical protein